MKTFEQRVVRRPFQLALFTWLQCIGDDVIASQSLDDAKAEGGAAYAASRKRQGGTVELVEGPIKCLPLLDIVCVFLDAAAGVGVLSFQTRLRVLLGRGFIQVLGLLVLLRRRAERFQFISQYLLD